MRVLVTGGTGYLGSAIVPLLVVAGHSVTLFARSRPAQPPASAVEFIAGDVTDAASVDRALARADAVVHLAACVTRVSRVAGEHDRVNVGGARCVLEAAARRGIRSVYASSFLALGPSARGALADEDGPFDAPPLPMTPYAASKMRALQQARSLAAGGAPLVITVPGVIYGAGPSRESNYVGALLARLAAGRLPALPNGGATRLTWAPVADVARAHVALLTNGRIGATYILGGPVASVRDALATAARLLGVATPRASVPLGVVEAMGAIAEGVWRLGGPAPFVTRAEARTHRADWAYASRRAERELGYHPASLEDGMRAAVAGLARPRSRA